MSVNRAALVLTPIIVVSILIVALLFFGTPVDWPPELTPAALAIVAGYALSWATQKVPILKTWYDSLPGEDKGLVQLTSAVGVGVGLFAASVLAIAPPQLAVEVSIAGAVEMLIVILSMFISGQARYVARVAPRKAALKAAAMGRLAATSHSHVPPSPRG